jgi:hypothetical protein
MYECSPHYPLASAPLRSCQPWDECPCGSALGWVQRTVQLKLVRSILLPLGACLSGWYLPVFVQLGMLQEGAEQAQRQEAAAKAVLKAAQVGPM